MKFPIPNEHVLPHLIDPILPPKLSRNSNDVNRFIGALLGLAVGDSLGAGVSNIASIRSMAFRSIVGGSPEPHFGRDSSKNWSLLSRP